MSTHVHFLHELNPVQYETVSSNISADIILSFGEDPSQFREVELLIGDNPVPGWFNLQSLRSVIVPWAGVPGKTVALLRDNPHVTLYNLHYNAQQTAEMAVALLFSAAKFVVPLDQKLRQNDWTPRYQPNRTFLLQGKTALVLGYGAIGQNIGRMLKGIGMTVLGTVRSSVKERPYADEIHLQEKMSELFLRTDVLMIALPLTEETRGLVGENELAILPDDAIVINVGRGPIVDERALYNALKSGTLGAVGLDVWWNYPKGEETWANTPPSNFPLYEFENVVLSPHRGGAVRDKDETWASDLARMINIFASGEEMPNRVNVEVGY